MSDAKIVDVAEGLATALETARDASDFETTSFDVEWDFEGRNKDKELTDNDLHVRVIVPKEEIAYRHDRTELSYVATYDIDVRQKLGVANQGSGRTIEKEELKALVRLVEQIHEYFWLNPRPIDSIDAEWIDKRDGIKETSRILVPYSPHYLRDYRQFFGVCREVFEVTGEDGS
jgi:hypothetical protein